MKKKLNRIDQQYRANVNKMKNWLIENGYYSKDQTYQGREFIIKLYFFTRLNINLDNVEVDNYKKLVHETLKTHPL